MIDLQITEYQQRELSQPSDVVREQADQLALVTEENRRFHSNNSLRWSRAKAV